MNTKEKDKKYLGRDVPAEQLEIVNSKGDYLIDLNGRKYIDFLMGWCVGNIGWGNKDIAKKLNNYKGPTYVLPHYLYKPWAELAELLAKISLGKLTKSFRATGGTEAVEIAMQSAMSHTKRHKFISIEGSYHGHSIGAMSIGDSSFRNWYKNLLSNCYKIKPPLNAEAGKQVEKMLSKKDIAGFIMEPIICNLGVIMPDKEFIDIVAKACKKYGTLFIADEVATGFGRTGKMFASEHYNLEPDIMCLAKGLTGGYGASGATIMTEEVAKSMEFDFSFYSTFGWTPMNVEATLANIKYILKNKNQIFRNVSEMSKYFEKRLQGMNFKYPAKIRIKGLAIGVEFEKDGYAGKVVKKCRDNGLLFSTLGSTMFTLFPALNINKKIAKKGLDLMEKSI
jgi:acetylornithine/succinyldiaminopimelate/putrescine aminotransferase